MDEDAPRLSARERAILRGIADGKTYAQIGFAIGVGHETVKTNANRLRAKLGVASKVGLALYWERNLKEPADVDDAAEPGVLGQLPEGDR